MLVNLSNKHSFNSFNKLQKLPLVFWRARKLNFLNLDGNQVLRLPTNLPSSIKILSARNNQIEFTELARFQQFEKLELEGNPFRMKMSHVIELPNFSSVPSLVQLAAQKCLNQRFQYTDSLIPWNICNMLDSARFCPCSKPIWQRRNGFAEYFLLQEVLRLPKDRSRSYFYRCVDK